MTDVNDDLSVLVMAGGAGTRFWPVSTAKRPKQFLSLLSERTLLQASVDRVLGMVPPERILVLTNADFVPLVSEQLPDIPPQNIIGEPMRRDTAAAVALGALLLERTNPDGIMAVLTADHRIEPVADFQAVLSSAAAGARENKSALYTFGVVPTFPSTAYGYLHRAEELQSTRPRHYRLADFKEKPPAEVASEYLASGQYYWNSGMFVWSYAAIVQELTRQLPEHVSALAPAVAAHGGARFGAALGSAFAALESVSIDFGVMEGATDVRCVEATFEWNDVGGWLALEEFLERTDEGNAVKGRLHVRDAVDNIVFNEDDDEDIALIGVSDLIVVRAGKRTLVCRRDDAEAIKQLVGDLPPQLR
jgi:mannose-1-phosphate guanylyltransferase